jgi:polyisoprenoid-binding protein YceI
VKPLLITLQLLAGFPCFSQSVVNFIPSPVHFSIENAGLSVNGIMEGLEGMVTFNNKNIVIDIQASLQPSTIKTGIRLRDDHLKKEDYFDVQAFPKITMISTHITHKRKGFYVGKFDLTIKDVTKNFIIAFEGSSANRKYKIKGQFTLNRRDFALGEESLILSDEVIVYIELMLD